MTGPEVPGVIPKGGGGRGTRLPAPSFPQVHRLFNPPPAPPSHNYDDGTVDRSCPDKGLAPSGRYFYDYVATREPCVSGPSDVRKMVQRLPRLGGTHKRLEDPSRGRAPRPTSASDDRWAIPLAGADGRCGPSERISTGAHT